MTTILLGIDGTGPFLDKEYFADLNASFVAYILRHSKAKLKKYIRGPWAEGFDMASIVTTGYTFVHLTRAANKGARILLTGYSRGGSGVIGVAQRLKTQGVKVHGMILFDAVDRAVGVDTAVIPSNVERVVYARRDPSGNSRISFGNCGTVWRPPTKCELRMFRGTHGAIGGCHWKCPPGKKPTDLIEEPFEWAGTKVSYQQDLAAAKAVWTWVKPRVSALGLLESHPTGAYV
jgi:hypothetical protein